MQIKVIIDSTSRIQKEFYDWKKDMCSKGAIKIHSITPLSYEDRESNYSVTSLVIVYELYAVTS